MELQILEKEKGEKMLENIQKCFQVYHLLRKKTPLIWTSYSYWWNTPDTDTNHVTHHCRQAETRLQDLHVWGEGVCNTKKRGRNQAYDKMIIIYYSCYYCYNRVFSPVKKKVIFRSKLKYFSWITLLQFWANSWLIPDVFSLYLLTKSGI